MVIVEMMHVRRLTWDPGIVAHIARHNVAPDEVEQVCHGDPLVEQGYAGRLRLIGPTADGRVLAVILEPRVGGTYRPVTARPASREERTAFRDRERGDTHDE